MSEISLTASMRSNLLSLQNIASQQDIVQNRLATGLKVSSAIDNPSSYYTASSLNNRAADLTALLDSMSQGIQTIKAASEAIASGTKFLEQAKAVANQALETTDVFAVVKSEEEFVAAVNSGKTGTILVDGSITFSNNFQIQLHNGQNVMGKSESASLNFTSDKNQASILAADNNRFENLKLSLQNSSQTVNRYGLIQIDGTGAQVTAKNVNLNLNLTTNTANKAMGVFYLQNGSVLNLEGEININADGHFATGVALDDAGNAVGGSTLNVYGDLNIKVKDFAGLWSHKESNFNLKSGSKTNIQRSSRGEGIYIQNRTTFNIDYGAEVNLDTGRVFMQSNTTLNLNGCLNLKGEYIYLNGSAGLSGSSLNVGSRAQLYFDYAGTVLNIGNDNSFSIASGGIFAIRSGNNLVSKTAAADVYNIENISGTIQNITYADLLTDTLNFKEKVLSKEPDWNNLFPLPFPPSLLSGQISFSVQDFTKSQQSFCLMLEQYNCLVRDASYKGINLLGGQNLKINFNEDRSSKIDVAGVKADSGSLGLKTKAWNTTEDVEKSISELENAINTLRGFASEFGNYYSIVTTRQDFTENLINVLEEGADKLTLADMNQESANMLALQTAQQLAVNSLSLASQASQAVLKLF